MSDTVFDTLPVQTALLKNGQIVAAIHRLTVESGEHAVTFSTLLKPALQRRYKEQAQAVMTALEGERWKTYDLAYRSICAFFSIFPLPDDWKELASTPTPTADGPHLQGLEGFETDEDFWNSIDNLFRP